jgi:hypothetical protein
MLLYKPCRKYVQYKEKIYKKIVGVVGAWIAGINADSHSFAQAMAGSGRWFVVKYRDKKFFTLKINYMRSCV